MIASGLCLGSFVSKDGTSQISGGGMSKVALRTPFVCDVFSCNSSSPMVLGPVSCPAKVHGTTVFALRNVNLSGSCAPLCFVPVHQQYYASNGKKSTLTFAADLFRSCGKLCYGAPQERAEESLNNVSDVKQRVNDPFHHLRMR